METYSEKVKKIVDQDFRKGGVDRLLEKLYSGYYCKIGANRARLLLEKNKLDEK
ncbi:MAG: hypothetical protein P9M06_06405 [Candidatus Saelkia tenebricola]|nr:hypothetical protein [Candidatus Saelkia tenebricola]